KRFVHSVDVDAKHHRLWWQSIVAVRHAGRERSVLAQPALDECVDGRNTICIAWKRLQYERSGMQPLPFLPAREEERIKLQVFSLKRAGDRFEARLLPSASRSSVFEDFVASDYTVVVEHQRLAFCLGPEHEGRIAVASPGNCDRSFR